MIIPDAHMFIHHLASYFTFNVFVLLLTSILKVTFSSPCRVICRQEPARWSFVVLKLRALPWCVPGNKRRYGHFQSAEFISRLLLHLQRDQCRKSDGTSSVMLTTNPVRLASIMEQWQQRPCLQTTQWGMWPPRTSHSLLPLRSCQQQHHLIFH